MTISEVQLHRVNATRELLKWIVATKQVDSVTGGAIDSQRALAGALGCDPPPLSRFMSGMKNSKPMMLDKLVQLESNIKSNLTRRNLPTELPGAGAGSTTGGETSRASTSAAGGVSESTAPNEKSVGVKTRGAGQPVPVPVTPLPSQPAAAHPSAAIFTVRLTDVDGAQMGGEVHIMSTGSPVNDERWTISQPRSGSAVQLRLRLGFCARRSVPRGALGGRTFVFWLERLVSAEPSLDGGPLW